MSDLPLDSLTLALAIATVDGISADYVRIGVDEVSRDATARTIVVTGPDAEDLAGRIRLRLLERGYDVPAWRPSALPGAVDLTVSSQAATGAYDGAAQHARDLALHGFLDLNLGQWEAWLVDGSDLPSELEPYAVAVITSLRVIGDAPDARGDYLQAVASLTTSALQYFIDRVGKH